MDPITGLLKIRELVTDHAPQELAEWFDNGISQYMTGHDRKTLDTCLELGSTMGQATPRTKYLKQLRNEYIRKAAKQIEESKPTALSEKLTSEIRSFETRVYPRWLELDAPPANTSLLRQYLFRAAKTGEPLPNNWRQVYRILFDV